MQVTTMRITLTLMSTFMNEVETCLCGLEKDLREQTIRLENLKKERPALLGYLG